MGEAILARASSGGGGGKRADYVFEFYTDGSYGYLYGRLVSTTTSHTKVYAFKGYTQQTVTLDTANTYFDLIGKPSASIEYGVAFATAKPDYSHGVPVIPIWVYSLTTNGHTAVVEWFDGAEWHRAHVHDEGHTSSSNPLVVEVADTGLDA